MNSNRANQESDFRSRAAKITFASSYYALLGLHPSASAIDIRRAYRELSKRYHPDTTHLPSALATTKFQQLNEAYATLSNPERRLIYDNKIGYSRISVIQAPPHFHHTDRKEHVSSSAYLDPTSRPLSPGEIFALVILVVTFVGCLLLAVAVGLTRGDVGFEPLATSPPIEQQVYTKKNEKFFESN